MISLGLVIAIAQFEQMNSDTFTISQKSTTERPDSFGALTTRVTSKKSSLSNLTGSLIIWRTSLRDSLGPIRSDFKVSLDKTLLSVSIASSAMTTLFWLSSEKCVITLICSSCAWLLDESCLDDSLDSWPFLNPDEAFYDCPFKADAAALYSAKASEIGVKSKDLSPFSRIA